MSHSKEQEACNCYFKKYGYNNKTFFNRPHWTRRQFFRLAGAGVTVSFLSRKYARAADVTNSGMSVKDRTPNIERKINAHEYPTRQITRETASE